MFQLLGATKLNGEQALKHGSTIRSQEMTALRSSYTAWLGSDAEISTEIIVGLQERTLGYTGAAYINVYNTLREGCSRPMAQPHA